MPTYYAQTIFAKPLDQITEADLTSYFQQERDETLNLEFKSYTDKSSDTVGRTARENERIRGVLKAIGAFLNSSGGLLIWGAPTPEDITRDKKKVKICMGALAPVPEYYDRDAFFNNIASQNTPHQTDGYSYAAGSSSGWLRLPVRCAGEPEQAAPVRWPILRPDGHAYRCRPALLSVCVVPPDQDADIIY